jgi:hypothetical protein
MVLHGTNMNMIATSKVVLLFIIYAVSLSFFTGNLSYAETGVGKDIFKVIISIFNITRETGDIVATVTVNENSKVKSFDSDMFDFPVNTGEHLIEYIATFPGEEVKPGENYKACVLVLETTESICHEGTNSLGKRPEVVDISLDKIDTEEADTEEADTEEADTEEADTEEADTEEANTEEANTEEANTEEANTEEANTEEANTEEAPDLLPQHPE